MYFGFAIAIFIILQMFLSSVASGVAIFPILIVVGIGYGVMQFGDKEDGIILNKATTVIEITKIPPGQY